MLCPILTALGFFVDRATVQPFPNKTQGICTYSALIANPSTGKTPALNLIKKAILKIEAYFQVVAHESKLTNVASIEGLFDCLKKIPNLIGKLFGSY